MFLISVSQPDITFDTKLPQEPLMGRFDARLMGQALANVVKNATEAIAAVPASSEYKGVIEVVGRFDGPSIVVDVIDNGIGLPRENRQRVARAVRHDARKRYGIRSRDCDEDH